MSSEEEEETDSESELLFALGNGVALGLGRLHSLGSGFLANGSQFLLGEGLGVVGLALPSLVLERRLRVRLGARAARSLELLQGFAVLGVVSVHLVVMTPLALARRVVALRLVLLRR